MNEDDLSTFENEDDLSTFDIESELESPLDEDISDHASPAPDVEEMLALLESGDSSQRTIAARAFSEIQDERAIPHLIRLLTDICPLVRVSAAYGLGRNTSSDAVEPLIEQYHTDWNGYARKGIVWALGNCRDRRSVGLLVKALQTDISAVRLWAASGLAQIAHLDYEDVIVTIAPLIEGLRRDSVPAVRSNCAWALGQLARELPSNVVYATTIDALLEALVEDEELGVKEDAKDALLRVGDPRGLQTIEELELEGFI